jgi:transposase
MIPALSGAPPAGVRVLIATRPVDFRRGTDGLAATVQSVLRQDPFSGTIFVFRSKRADRVKMLVYDGTGLVLIWKRLEGAKFKWPAISDGVRCGCRRRNWRRCSRDSIGGGCMPQGLDGRRWPAKPPPSGLCFILTHLEVEDRTAPAA